ncbi:MAG: hypothetical protein KKD35_00155 [Elusimicrobia bacterium]|nr:hypothetical protein [Elusimicrobiota bacterium]
MEYAISLTPHQSRNIKPAILRKYDRVYLGSEFCQNILPSIDDINFLHDKGIKKISLLSGLMVTKRLQEFEKLLLPIFKNKKIIEIAVNDLGLLRFLNLNYPKRSDILLGRPVSIDYMRMSEKFLKSFFKKYNIKRIESDENNMVENLSPKSFLKVSFHFPLRYVCMTCYCPFEKKIALSCRHSCENKILKLKHSKMDKSPLILHNNAYFFQNEPSYHKAVKRLVYKPLSYDDADRFISKI